MGDDWVLGVDVGTSRSAGAIANGAVTPLEVEGNRWMPSMVLLDPDGTLVVGSAADYQAGVYPDRVERTPKRHLGGPALLLGGSAVEVPRAIASVISVFVKEGELRRDGQAPSATVLTHPVRWGDDRKAALADSARLAGLRGTILIEEPVAAAVHYVGDQVEVGQCVGVYDLGGGTFDTAVLARTQDGFEVIGAPGGDEFIGGEHFDHLVYEFLGTCLADDDPDLWEQVQFGEDRKWTRAAADLLLQARRAKEAVSSYPSTQVLLPLVDRDVVVTRIQLEDMIRAQVELTVDEMAATIASAGVVPEDLAALYLVGGSSRIPLVTQLMTERFGDRIATRDEPKGVVALGAAQVARQHTQRVQSPAPAAASLPPPLGPAGTRLPPPPGSYPAPPAAAGPPGGRPHFPGSAPSPSGPATSPLGDAWQVDLRSDVHAIAAVGPSIHVTDGSSRVHQLGLDGRWRWSARLPGQAYGRPAHAGDLVMVGCTENALMAIDQGAGRERFRVPTRGPVVTGPLSVNDVVLVADDSSTVSAYGTRDGVLRWMLPIGAQVRAPMTIAGSAVLVAGSDGKVFRVDQATGAVSWAFPAPAAVTAAPMVVDDEAYIASTNGVLYAIDIRTGHARWGAQLDGPIDGPGAVWGALVLVADRAGGLTAVSRRDSAVAWRVHTGGTNPTGLVLSGSIAYLDRGDGQLVAVDLERREVVAQAAIATGSWLSPTIAGGLVVVRAGTEVRALHAVRR